MDVEKMIRFHDLHKKFEENVVNTFKNLGISVKVVNRLVQGTQVVFSYDSSVLDIYTLKKMLRIQMWLYLWEEMVLFCLPPVW